MSRSSKPRFLRNLAVAAIALVIIAVTTLRIQQWVLRNRAERLLTDLQQIELRKTSFEDAQKLFAHWNEWGHYEGECTRDHCLFSIALRDFLDARPSLFKRASLNFLYSVLGGGPTDVNASITVINGVVWEKSFGLRTSSRGLARADAAVSTDSRLPAIDERFSLHPDHAIVPLQLTPCVSIRVKFTPYEDPVEVRRLMEFDLSPITHWGFGREKNDVMPAACAEARQEQHFTEQPTPTGTGQPDSPRHESLEYLARDAGRVAVIRILSKPGQSTDPWLPWKIDARLEQPLKHYSAQDVGMNRELHLHCSDAGWTPETRVGELYLIFTDWSRETENVTCGGILSVTEENLAAARRGIAQDYKAAFAEPKR